MLARVNGTYRKTLAFARVVGAYRAVKNVYARVGTVWRPVWAYSWDVDGWGGCTVGCGGGTQTRTVRCLRNDGVEMSDTFCSESGAKPSTSQACNTHPCYTYLWQTEPWGDCSKPCGSGTKYRTVYCRRNDGANVSDSYCSGSKPATSQYCNNGTCRWWTSSWSGWSTTCGNATRTRTVTCDDPYGNTVSDSYCSGTKPGKSESLTICTGCTYNETAYLNNKLKQIRNLGSAHPPPPSGGSWNIASLRSYTISYWGSVMRHYNTCSAQEKVCGHSNTACCNNAGRTNNGPACTITA